MHQVSYHNNTSVDLHDTAVDPYYTTVDLHDTAVDPYYTAVDLHYTAVDHRDWIGQARQHS